MQPTRKFLLYYCGGRNNKTAEIYGPTCFNTAMLDTFEVRVVVV